MFKLILTTIVLLVAFSAAKRAHKTKDEYGVPIPHDKLYRITDKDGKFNTNFMIKHKRSVEKITKKLLKLSGKDNEVEVWDLRKKGGIWTVAYVKPKNDVWLELFMVCVLKYTIKHGKPKITMKPHCYSDLDYPPDYNDVPDFRD